MNAPFPVPAKAKKVSSPIEPIAGADGWYVEHERVTDALLARERFIGPVWDPACGQGNILRALARAGVPCAGSDLRRRVPRDLEHLFAGTFDFLDGDIPTWSPFAVARAANIICNPPFYKAAGAEAFIRRALAIAPGKVAMHVELRFIGGGKRAAGLFAEHRPARIYMIAPRSSCPPGEILTAGGKIDGGKQDFVWIVWDRTVPALETRWDWLLRATTNGGPA